MKATSVDVETPRHRRFLAPQLAVDEVADAAGAQPDRHQRGDEIRDLQHRPLQRFAVQPHCSHDPQQAAVKRHPALRDLEDVKRIVEPQAPTVEKAVAQAPADNDADHAVENQVVDLFRGNHRPGLLRAPRGQQPGSKKTDDVHQPVPANRERTYRKDNRVDFRVGQHEAGFYTIPAAAKTMRYSEYRRFDERPMNESNRLAGETSPYLLQHADNPVDWYPWGPEALELARATGKPILLSIGYSACHWCHVMAHESFEDDEVAALMNRLYVNIKVDREERPDID